MVDVIAALEQCAFSQSCWKIDQRYRSCWIGVKCMGIILFFICIFRFLFNELSSLSMDLVILFLNMLVKHVLVYYF